MCEPSVNWNPQSVLSYGKDILCTNFLVETNTPFDHAVTPTCPL